MIDSLVSRRRRLVDAVALALATSLVGSVALAAAPANASAMVFDAGETSQSHGTAGYLPSSPLVDACLAKQDAGGDAVVLRADAFGFFPVPAGGEYGSECGLAKNTLADLKVIFGSSAETAVRLQSAPTFIAAPGANAVTEPARRFVMRTVEPVLCESYFPDANTAGLALQLTDSSGAVQVVRGIDRWIYSSPGAATLPSSFSPVSAIATATSAPFTQCLPMPFVALTTSSLPDVGAGTAGAGGSQSIFGSGFEVPTTPVGTADLRVEFLVEENGQDVAYTRVTRDAVVGQTFSYRVRIRNEGPVPATGVRLREFLHYVGEPDTTPRPRLTAQGWTCAPSCGTGAAGPLSVQGITLAAKGQPGSSQEYVLTRPVPAQTVADNTFTAVAAGLFYDPTDTTARGDVATSDNLATMAIRLTNNPGPQIACTEVGGTGRALSTVLASIAEGDSAVNFSCVITDANNVASVEASQTGGRLQTPLLGSGAGIGTASATFPLTVSLVDSDTSGAGSLSITAVDAAGAQTVLAINFNVTEINDAPSFDITGVDTSAPADGIIDRRIATVGLRGSGGVPFLIDQNGQTIDLTALPAGTITVVRDANCGTGSACSVRIVDFFRFVDAGPAAEVTAGQQVTVGATACNQGGLEAFFFTDPRSGVVAPAPHSVSGVTRPSGSNYDLVFTYDKSSLSTLNSTCNFRFLDTGSPAATSADSASRAVLFQGFAGS